MIIGDVKLPKVKNNKLKMIKKIKKLKNYLKMI